MVTYTSEFGRDFEKYGYVDQGTSDSAHSINWKSQTMDRNEAVILTNEINSTYDGSMTFTPPMLMQITTYGKFSWQHIIENRHELFQNGLLMNHLRPKFIREYKKKLFDLVAEKSTKVL
jgi:hypothetical protein